MPQKYLLFADMLVGLIFKALLNTSKRHMPVIFGNILTETGERQRERVKTESRKMTDFNPLC